ncbi:MAG: YchJ family protein [Bdellovibrionales bacterium]|nr:YchJ family protein [Bdellovibrionales bacterium]
MENIVGICPCGSQKLYHECCEPIILKKRLAKTAEELMRSRYSAFVQNAMEHIQSTHDPSTRNDLDMEGNQAWSERAKWKGLEIIKTEAGTENDSEGTVEFIASYEMDGEPQKHHELSFFKKIKDKWYFIDGKNLSVATFQREQPKIGRNDPCSCGSGKKYKKCCG